MNKSIALVGLALSLLGVAHAVGEEILKVDFTGGTAGAEAFRFDVPSPSVTVSTNIIYDHIYTWIRGGGTPETVRWKWSADGESVYCTDLHTAAPSPTRLDTAMGMAATDKQYTLTDAVLTLAGSVTNDIHFRFTYAVGGVVRAGPSTVISNGTSGSVSLDLSGLELLATDTGIPWDYRSPWFDFWEPNGSNVDWIAIDSLVVNALVEDEPQEETDTLWEFNTLGDVEGWSGSEMTGLDVTNAASGSETVLSSTDISGIDPKLTRPGVYSPASDYWTHAVIRVRQLDDVGTPVPWESVGCAVVVGGTTFDEIGDESWYIVQGSNEWITASINISAFTNGLINGVRFDPVGGVSATNKNFEVDYIELQTSTNQPPAKVLVLVTGFEFNTAGDTEGFSSTLFSNLTVAAAVSGPESVLTCEDVTGNDAKLLYSDGITGATKWDRVEFRARQLDGNNGTPSAWNTIGTVLIAGSHVLQIVTEDDVDGWVVGTCDMSSVEGALSTFRFDPVGGLTATNQNFEVDYIRFYGLIDGYEVWAFDHWLEDGDAVSTADPDNDGANNFAEHAFGGNPNDSSNVGIPVEWRQTSTDVMEYVYTYRNTPLIDYSIAAKDSLILGSWTNYTGYTETGTATYNSLFNVATNQILFPDESTKFFNVRATSNE